MLPPLSVLVTTERPSTFAAYHPVWGMHAVCRYPGTTEPNACTPAV